jgi:hypothetical protein
MSSWQQLLHHGEPGDHLVYLYGQEDDVLVRSIAGYVIEGIRQRDLVLVVATPAHAESVRHQIAREDSSQVHFLDAATLLRDLLGDGEPDWDRVRHTLGNLVRDIRATRPGAGLRIFGEMVGLLWSAGRTEDAERLEASWNAVQALDRFNLLCAYPVDIYDSELDPATLRGIFAAHSHSCAGGGTLFSTARKRHPS